MESKTSFKVSDSSKSGTMAFMKAVFETGSEITCARFNSEDNLILCGTNDGRLCAFNLNTSSKVSDFEASERPSPITNIKVNMPLSVKITTLLVTTALGEIIELQIIGKNYKKSWVYSEENNYYQGLAYSPTYEHFAVAGQDCAVRIFDNEKKELSRTLKGQHWKNSGHNNRVFCLKYHPVNPNLIVTGGWDMSVRLWDLRQETPAKGLVGPKICGEAVDINDAGLLVTGACRSKEQVQLWDIFEEKLLKSLQYGPKGYDNDMLYCCAFQKGHKNSVLVGGTTSVKIFSLDVPNDKFERVVEITDIKSNVYALDSGNSSSKFLFGTAAGQCVAFNISRVSE